MNYNSKKVFINIDVAKYYNKPQIYPFMPPIIFNALENAFLSGQKIIPVPEVEFKKMLNAIKN